MRDHIAGRQNRNGVGGYGLVGNGGGRRRRRGRRRISSSASALGGGVLAGAATEGHVAKSAALSPVAAAGLAEVAGLGEIVVVVVAELGGEGVAARAREGLGLLRVRVAQALLHPHSLGLRCIRWHVCLWGSVKKGEECGRKRQTVGREKTEE